LRISAKIEEIAIINPVKRIIQLKGLNDMKHLMILAVLLNLLLGSTSFAQDDDGDDAAATREAGDTRVDAFGIEQVWVPAGCFMMGIKVERGGWWGSNPYVARATYRHFEDSPFYEDHHIGFRVVTAEGVSEAE
jgi:hypothetical protein